MSELDDLKRILKASEGKYGMVARIAKIEERIAEIENPPVIDEETLPPQIRAERVRYRSSITGHYVTPEYALHNPETTYREAR